jgi:hypothetical protein
MINLTAIRRIINQQIDELLKKAHDTSYDKNRKDYIQAIQAIRELERRLTNEYRKNAV